MFLNQDNGEIVSISSIVKIVLRSNGNWVSIVVECNHWWKILILHSIQVNNWCVNVIWIEIGQFVVNSLIDPQVEFSLYCSCKIRSSVIWYVDIEIELIKPIDVIATSNDSSLNTNERLIIGLNEHGGIWSLQCYQFRSFCTILEH